MRMWWCVWLVLCALCRIYAQATEVDCLTADGSVGRCIESSKCMTSYNQVNTVLCRYSRGYGTRICCPRSAIWEREDAYSNDSPIAFPEEPYSGFDSHSQPTKNTHVYNPYNNRPSNYKPHYHEKPSYTQSPVYQERPQYGSSTSNYEVERPSFSSGSIVYQEKPNYSSGSNGNQERPSYSGGSNVYQERPNYSGGSNVYQERPNYSGGSNVYQERPNYSGGSNSNQERPNYSGGSNVYQERPNYSGGSNGNQERPNYSGGSNVYQERPNFSGGSNGNQERPSYSGGSNVYQERPSYSGGSQGSPSRRPDRNRPKPGSHINTRETTTSWELPSSDRRTTPRPSWAVEDNNSGSSSNSRGRISEQKCEEYSQPVSQTINALPLSIDSEAVPLRVQSCDFSAVKLIVGGEASELGEFPHMAAVGFRSPTSRNILWNCGGTLISERYVLTAGHCTNTSNGNPVMVRLGEYNIEKDNDGADPRDYGVQRVIVHPSYFKTLKYNDIALLRLERDVGFNKLIRPACLPTDNNIRGKPVATGWGRTAYAGRQSEILMKVALNVIDNRQCNTYYNTNSPSSSSFASGIVDTMLCAGYVEGGRDTCLGDSGGPLTTTKRDNPCIHYVVGITSFGKICAAPKSPGVYTRVVKYLDWIEKIVWP